MDAAQAPSSALEALMNPSEAAVDVVSSADDVLDISFWKLPVLALLLLIPVSVSYVGKLGLTMPLIIAACRSLVQLMLLGGILKVLLSNNGQLLWTMLYVTFMMLVASLEAGARPSMSYIVRPCPLSSCTQEHV
jgi:ABC-type iron transport system FetAB permease component